MGVKSLPKTVTRQRCGCDLNPGPTAPESSTLTTRLPSHPELMDTSCIFSLNETGPENIQLVSIKSVYSVVK